MVCTADHLYYRPAVPIRQRFGLQTVWRSVFTIRSVRLPGCKASVVHYDNAIILGCSLNFRCTPSDEISPIEENLSFLFSITIGMVIRNLGAPQ